MGLYVKRPVEVEAFQMTKERRWDNKDWPTWLHQAWQKECNEDGSLFIEPNCPKLERLAICTLEGDHDVNFGDYIIQGVKGELYPCKPDIFELTYEEVKEVS